LAAEAARLQRDEEVAAAKLKAEQEAQGAVDARIAAEQASAEAEAAEAVSEKAEVVLAASERSEGGKEGVVAKIATENASQQLGAQVLQSIKVNPLSRNNNMEGREYIYYDLIVTETPAMAGVAGEIKGDVSGISRRWSRVQALDNALRAENNGWWGPEDKLPVKWYRRPQPADAKTADENTTVKNRAGVRVGELNDYFARLIHKANTSNPAVDLLSPGPMRDFLDGKEVGEIEKRAMAAAATAATAYRYLSNW